ncbi:acyl-CoA N-acyltransferase [Bimuria novae-zelandiae CBS 107.79]|uniref:Acyl-CoA N-acyltransferase n=1 Tax=Bimuria novae-zelandiae CBS 107.79 TaxID=1447943 RepID=A0A6A5VJC8_9PLEO|nr:acyl-CoA N-acyltransferase [Bimuria novae-zelandiae CBS 107.79]
MTLAFAHPYTLEHATTWIAMNKESPHNHLFLTTLEDPKTVIGGIGLKPGSDITSHTGEVGYWLAEPYQGRGLMSEALLAFIEWTFYQRDGDGSAAAEGKKPEVKKTRLFAGVLGGNTRSMRILEKCGFQKEGVQKGHIVTRYGELTDLHMYGLTVGDWEAWKKSRQQQ